MFKKDWLGLEKLDKDLNKVFKNMDSSLDMGETKTRKFPKPKPVYSKKKKPIMTKKDQETAKKIIKETGSAFGSLISKIKNRKINKLEKEYFKSKEKSEQLAHEIKLRIGIEDHENNIDRYEKELAKIKTPKQQEKEHSDPCIAYNMVYDNEGTNEIQKCICEVEE